MPIFDKDKLTPHKIENSLKCEDCGLLYDNHEDKQSIDEHGVCMDCGAKKFK